jgi:hypothetical protein
VLSDPQLSAPADVPDVEGAFAWVGLAQRPQVAPHHDALARLRVLADVVVVDPVGSVKRRFQVVCGWARSVLLQGCPRLLALHALPTSGTHTVVLSADHEDLMVRP